MKKLFQQLSCFLNKREPKVIEYRADPIINLDDVIDGALFRRISWNNWDNLMESRLEFSRDLAELKSELEIFRASIQDHWADIDERLGNVEEVLARIPEPKPKKKKK